jgi:hypothetical protein
LHQDQVLPPSELGTDFGHPSHLDETKSSMKVDRCVVGTINGGDHRVLSASSGLFDESLHEITANAFSPSVLAHMDRIFDGETVSRTFHDIAEPTKGSHADNFISIFGNQDHLVLSEPGQGALGREWRVGPLNCRGGDVGIQECGNGHDI